MARPHTPLLDRDRITDAAMALVDETGDFTVPGLARSLNVQTASIYHHVDGRAGIIELLRTRAAKQMDLGALDVRPWDVGLAAVARSYRAVFAAHPRLVPLLATTPVRSPMIIAAYERVAVMLHDAGFRPEDALCILTAVENLVIGSALDLATAELEWEVPEEADAPRFARAIAAAPTGVARADRSFELGLTALIRGFSAALDDEEDGAG